MDGSSSCPAARGWPGLAEAAAVVLAHVYSLAWTLAAPGREKICAGGGTGGAADRGKQGLCVVQVGAGVRDGDSRLQGEKRYVQAKDGRQDREDGKQGRGLCVVQMGAGA